MTLEADKVPEAETASGSSGASGIEQSKATAEPKEAEKEEAKEDLFQNEDEIFKFLQECEDWMR